MRTLAALAAALACASCSPRQALAPTAADPLDAILDASDVGHAAIDIPRIVRDGVDAQLAAKLLFDPQRKQRARQAIAELWTPEKLLGRIRWKICQKLSSADVAEVTSALGARGMSAFADVGTRARRADPSAVDAWLAGAHESSARTALQVRLLQATGLIDAQRMAVDLSVRAAAELSHQMLDPPSDEASQRVAEVSESFGSRQLPEDFEDAMVPATSYVLRDVPDAELQRALAFWESELGQRYRAALEEGVQLAVQDATEKTLRSIRGE